MSGWRVNEVVFEDVCVPKECLIGEKNRGWEVLTLSLAEERAGLGAIRNLRKIFQEILNYAKEKNLLVDDEIRRRISEAYVRLEVARLLFYEASWRQSAGLDFSVSASISKLFSSELYRFVSEIGMDIVGIRARETGLQAPFGGEVEYIYKHCVAATIGGGTSQIQKNLIATLGLGLTK
jgi:alkylation response protein AidB-like acyl-CoA dehydrogenase